MIGERIAMLRKGKGWTQNDLANATRLSRGYIASIEGGRSPGVKAAYMISRALGVEVRELYEGEISVRQITP